jgi:hypothetical protein
LNYRDRGVNDVMMMVFLMKKVDEEVSWKFCFNSFTEKTKTKREESFVDVC